MRLSQLRAIVRATVASVETWPNEKIDTYLGQAIRLYSAHFPRPWRYTLTLTTGTQAYDLPGGHGFVQITSVQYPTTDEEAFLTEAPEWAATFINQDQVYALRGMSDTVDVDKDDAAGQIVFAETVTTGEYAYIDYLGLHPVPTLGDDDALITVPSMHLEALTAYVEFATHVEAETDEIPDVTYTSIVLAQLGENARRAWNRYKEIMDRLTWLGTGASINASLLPAWTDYGL